MLSSTYASPTVHRLLPTAFDRCAAMITVSEGSRRDIVRLWPRLTMSKDSRSSVTASRNDMSRISAEQPRKASGLQLYMYTAAVLYPTLYEGFGLPALEAHVPLLQKQPGTLTASAAFDRRVPA